MLTKDSIFITPKFTREFTLFKWIVKIVTNIILQKETKNDLPQTA